MELGIFAKTFSRPTLEETLDDVLRHGLRTVQFNLACAGLPSLPAAIEPQLAERIRVAHDTRRIRMCAVSGTFNMIDPDMSRRREGLRRLDVLANTCARLGTQVITLCTGTRDPLDMWRGHPENATQEAWRDLVASLEQALATAERYDVTLAIEPEPANVVDSALTARRLLDELRAPRLKLVIDAANLVHGHAIAEMPAILDQAFALVGDAIVIAHAKDVTGGAGVPVRWAAAGRGTLDYDHYLSLLRRAGFGGPLVLHSLSPAEVDDSVRFLEQKLARLDNGTIQCM
jgi:sugar phosphate isomerase/epimerase